MATREEMERLVRDTLLEEPLEYTAGRAFGWELIGLWALTGLVLLGAIGFVALGILGAAWLVSTYGWLKVVAGLAAVAGSWLIFHALIRVDMPASRRARRAYR